MLDLYPSEVKRKFVNMFIREMILNTTSANFYFLEELLLRENKIGTQEDLGKKEIKEVVKEYYEKNPNERYRDRLREREISFDIDFSNYDEKGKLIKPLSNSQSSSNMMVPVGRPILPPSKKVLRIPEHRLPQRFMNLKPVRDEKKQLDLGKLNPLIMDKNVRVIECQGAGISVMVGGSMGRKPTNIVLTEEEIGSIINEFSVESRIPIEEGIFKVAVGHLVLTSTVSETGSNFIIKKI